MRQLGLSYDEDTLASKEPIYKNSTYIHTPHAHEPISPLNTALHKAMVRGDRDRRLSAFFHRLAIAPADDISDQGSDHTVLPRAPPAVPLTRREHGNAPREGAYLAYQGWVLDQGPSEWSDQTN
jgi:hypothetical protein